MESRTFRSSSVRCGFLRLEFDFRTQTDQNLKFCLMSELRTVRLSSEPYEHGYDVSDKLSALGTFRGVLKHSICGNLHIADRERRTVAIRV